MVCEGHRHHCDGTFGVSIWDICFTSQPHTLCEETLLVPDVSYMINA